MSANLVAPRAEIPTALTWDVASVFADSAAWDAAAQALEDELPALSAYRGRLTESAALLQAWLQRVEAVQVAMGRLTTYATMCFDAETGDAAHAARYQRAQGLVARTLAALAFEGPELVAAGRERVEALLAEAPELAAARHRFDNLLRRAAHVRSVEVEETLALAVDPLWSFYTARSALVDLDMPHRQVTLPNGEPADVAEGTIGGLLEHPDRAVRRQAWEQYSDGFLGLRHTLAAQLAGHVKGSLFEARVRHYPSARVAALDGDNLPPAAFDHVVSAFRDHVGVWHRYWQLLRRAQRVEVLAPYDLAAPLTSRPAEVSYDTACRWILDGMAPLGTDYTEPLRRGLYEERWVDVLPSSGKRGGAYSGGAYGTRPFILLNWTGGLSDMSILAHELGHSMHSYFSRAQQPPMYADYSSFVAEVASNFNQALVRAHLLAAEPDPEFQLDLVGEAMANFRRYFFIMPILAQLEDGLYRRAEVGEGLTADGAAALLVDLFRHGYGDAVALDLERVGIIWAQFPHMYMNYYVFQYATGIAAANALADGVLAGGAEAAERYLAFLKAGGSCYPAEALRLAGVDMTSREPIDRAFGVLERLVDRLEVLLAATGR